MESPGRCQGQGSWVSKKMAPGKPAPRGTLWPPTRPGSLFRKGTSWTDSEPLRWALCHSVVQELT